MFDLKINFFKTHFDINKWLEERRKRKILRIQSICPHVYIKKEGERYSIESFVFTVPGTVQWQCHKCKMIFEIKPTYLDQEFLYWIKNPKELRKRMEKTDKLIKKFLR